MTNTTLDLGWQSSQSFLTDFLEEDRINDKLLTTFGDNFAVDTGLSLLQSLATGELTIPIAVVPSAAINNARGAYAASNNTIYLSTELLASGDVGAVTRVLLEETGHYLDSQINSNDAPGDEGAIFASFVLGEELSDERLQLLQAEDDTAIVELNGKSTLIEQMSTIYVNDDATGGGVTMVHPGQMHTQTYNQL